MSLFPKKIEFPFKIDKLGTFHWLVMPQWSAPKIPFHFDSVSFEHVSLHTTD